MSILCTGVAGFIASHLAERLTSLGEEVIGVDALLEGSNVKNLTPGFKFIKLDLRDRESLSSLFKDYLFHTVYHLAAMTHVDTSIESDALFWECNVLGTANLLRECRQSRPLVINQITDEVFGSKDIGYSLEDDPFFPTSPYACSKAAQYFAGQAYFKTFGLPVISTFPSNTYGPRQALNKLIPKFTTKLLANEKVPLMSSVWFRRDWMAVSDHVEALICLASKGKAGERYSFGANHHVSNMGITIKLLELTGRNLDAIETVPDRLAHDGRYAVSSRKIKALGWKPLEDFDTYIEKTVNWYRSEHGLSGC